MFLASAALNALSCTSYATGYSFSNPVLIKATDFLGNMITHVADYFTLMATKIEVTNIIKK